MTHVPSPTEREHVIAVCDHLPGHSDVAQMLKEVDIFDDVALFCPDICEPGEEGAHIDTGDTNTGSLTPPGEPPALTAQQRARLHQLLLQRDDQGRVPDGLDEYTTDEAKWKAYRKALKAQYRQIRREQRQRGEWEPDAIKENKRTL